MESFIIRVSTAVFILLSIRALAAPAYGDMPVERFVYDPPLTTPKKGAVWTVGSTQIVKWDLCDHPKHIANYTGQLVLAKSGLLNLEHPLAKKVDILSGEIQVIVPDVPSGHDYSLVLFGDSGNSGPQFTIRPSRGGITHVDDEC